MNGQVSDLVLGLLRTAGLDVALPLSVLREVVPCPPELDEVPAAAPGLLGVLRLRGALVPVVDLLPLLDRPHPPARNPVVVVLAHDGRLLGLLVDEVRGLATLRHGQLTPVEASGPRLLFSHAFPADDGAPVSVLDPDVLLALPGVPVVRDLPRESGTGTSSGGVRPLTVVRCGQYRLALDVAVVQSTVPSPALSTSVVAGPTCLGVTPVAGSDVAVVDLLALLGLGDLVGAELDCGAVVELPDGKVVLGVASMVGLFDVPVDAVVPLPSSASPRPDLLREVVDVAGVGACLLVDPEGLLQAPEVVVLSRLTVESEEQGQGSVVRRPVVGPPHLAYRAGVDVATPLSQVAEVLAHPEDLVDSAGAAHVLGFVLHRGAAVTVLSLAALLGREPAPVTPASRLLLVDVDGAPVAFAVESLQAILPPVWLDTDPRPAGSDPLRAAHLVELDGVDALLPSLDLVGLARGQRVDVPAPREPERLAQTTEL